MKKEMEFDEATQAWHSACSSAVQAVNPNTALLTTILDKNGQMRRVTLLYNANDNWFGLGVYDKMEEMHIGIINLMQRDNTILGFQTQAYNQRESGLFVPGTTFEPSKL